MNYCIEISFGDLANFGQNIKIKTTNTKLVYIFDCKKLITISQIQMYEVVEGWTIE